MSSKKKLTISLCSLIVLCMLGIVGIVSVYAAKTTTVNNQFTIKYTASNVHATISAKYAIKKGDTTVKEENLKSGAATEIEFTGNEVTGSGDCTKAFDGLGELKLNDEQNLVFVYTIKNTDVAGGDAFSVALSENPDTDNDNLNYTYSVTVGGTDVTDPAPVYNSLVASLAPQATAVITIKIDIANRDLDVNFTKTGLSFILQRVHAA